MNFNWLKARQTKYTGYATVYIGVIVAVLVTLNFLANRHNQSYDSTANKQFSLSEQTENIVRGLENDITITYFDQSTNYFEGRDLLERYDNLSPRLTVRYVDPDREPQLARAAGISVYGTVYVETLGASEETTTLTEEAVTNALIRALKGDVRTVCVVSGSGEHELDDAGAQGYSTVKALIDAGNYESRTVNLLENPTVPSDCTVLMVAGPKIDYLDVEVNAIREFAEAGGSTLFMLRPPLPDGQRRIGQNAGLVELLESWGVTVHTDLVQEEDPQKQQFQMGPEVLIITDYGTHEIVQGMSYATLVTRARSMEATSGADASVSELFFSSPDSYASTNLDNPSDPNGRESGPHTLAVAGTIALEGANEPAADAGEPSEESAETPTEARFVVVGSSEWVANAYVRSVGNQDIFLNMLNWLTADEDLISIRPKDPEDRRLEMTSSQMSTLFWLNVLGLPLFIIGTGIIVWSGRR